MATMEQAVFPQILFDRWEQVSQKIVQLAEAIPHDQLDWRPCEGSRTTGEILRHVAFWNRYLADTLNGKDNDGSANELPAADYPTKGDVIRAMETSAGQVSAAMRDKPAAFADAIATVLGFIEHTSEHYGQLVVYSRLLGIVPPASRG